MVKVKISVSIDAELVNWIDKEISTRRFRNRSHAVEYTVAKFIEREKKE